MNQDMEKQTAGVQHVSQKPKKVNKDIVAKIKVILKIVTVKFLWFLLIALIGDFVIQSVKESVMLLC